MANRTVTVLTVNGRRQQIKVEPNITILEILEQVCKKHNFNVNEYDLKHHNKVLDLSAMFRFSGLPNNALLEMAPTSKVRTESDVTLVVQTEDGSRLEGTFKPSASLLDVLKQLCNDKADAGANPVMIYMRKEVLWESMESTTLKSLGLTGGRAIIRLLQRKPEELKTQANVSAPLPIKEKAIDTDELVQEQENKSIADTVEKQPKQMTIDSAEPIDKPASPNAFQKSKFSDISPEEEPSCSKSKPVKTETNFSKVVEKKPKQEPVINIIGDREAVLFHLESAERSSFELPDSFYEVTVSDVRKMYADLRKQVKEIEEAPLMTNELRQLEDNKRVLNQLALYKVTIVRVQFVDRYVLQAIFKPHELVADVVAFVRNHLSDPTIEFHLYTTPPKIIVSPDSTLVEAKCVPQVLLHFGCEKEHSTGKLLKTALYEQLSNATGATAVAARSRGNLLADSTESTDTPMDTEPESEREPQPSESEGNASQRMPHTNFRASSVQSASSDVKMPKWFKPMGK
ncbi:tether containing UBX domain for GLUT4 [Wyeomyia smithii]|uniref:tether containing UBX domain for GLUT4 n=1 Tax=Wyeomyia smithii TaxID=174621 RepID=UPI002467B539|nr:tether containing UBX domain for GLUT4 [Wyeomyia smithii]